MSTSPIPAQKLRLRCDPTALGFETTAEVEGHRQLTEYMAINVAVLHAETRD